MKMNIFKNIFASKQKSLPITEDKKLDDKDIIIDVPEPEKSESSIPVLKDEFNTFNVVRQQEDTNLYFRLMSEKSSEIFRMNCSLYEYLFRDLRFDLSPEARKCFGYEVPYLRSEDRWHFIVRIFVTAKKRYFYQFIRSDGSYDFKLVDEKWLQHIIKECESNKKEKVFYENMNYTTKWVSKPGAFTLDKFNRDVCKQDKIQLIDDYEIIDKQLYDSIIEVF